MQSLFSKNNYFEFNKNVCKQISGTTIGTKFAPPYSCIFMDDIETSFLKTQQLQRFIWLRYIDDIFFVWTHGHSLIYFSRILTSFIQTWNLHTKRLRIVHFLDHHVSLKDGAIFTDLHIKPTDGYQFLHHKSSRPSYINNSIPFSQALRISRLCSSQSDFNAHTPNLKDWFLARDYPQKVVEEQIDDKVVFAKQPTRKDNSEQVVPFAAPYYPKLKDLG